MNEPTSKIAYNKAAPRRIVKVMPKQKKPRQKTYQPSPISNKPLIKLDPVTIGSSPVLTLDVEQYIHQFKDFVMTEEEKIEVLNDLWNIMCRFVEIGFGMDSHTLACEQRERDSRLKDGDLIDLSHLTTAKKIREDCP